MKLREILPAETSGSLPVGMFDCVATRSSRTESGYNLLHFTAVNKADGSQKQSVIITTNLIDVPALEEATFELEVSGHNAKGYAIQKVVVA